MIQGVNRHLAKINIWKGINLKLVVKKLQLLKLNEIVLRNYVNGSNQRTANI